MQNVSKGEPQRATPNHNWNLEQLTSYVKDCLKCRDEMNEDLAALGRKSAVELFRAGRALHFIREKLKVQNAYIKWLEDIGVARTTAHEAIKLYYKAKKESALEKMTITEAKIKFGVTKSKPSKSSVPNNKKKDGTDVEAGTPFADDTKADTWLLAMAKRLPEVAQWDRSDLDAQHLDRLARHCIRARSTQKIGR